MAYSPNTIILTIPQFTAKYMTLLNRIGKLSFPRIFPVLFCALLSVASAESTESPLAWDQTQIILHVSPDKDRVEAWFTYANLSTAPVTITRIETGCDCATTEIDRATLYPDESGALLAVIDVSAKSLPATERIHVHTESPKTKSSHTTVLSIHLHPAKENEKAKRVGPN